MCGGSRNGPLLAGFELLMRVRWSWIWRVRWSGPRRGVLAERPVGGSATEPDSPARPEISTTTAYVSDAPAVGARGGAEFSVTMRRDMHDNVMTVAGGLDVASAPKLADALRRLEHSQHKDLSLDCAGIRFCDCAGLSVLITAARRRRAAGGWLRLVNPSAALRRISGLAGVGPVLGINQIEIVQNNSQ